MRFPTAVSSMVDPVLMNDLIPLFGSFHPYVSASVPPLSPPNPTHPHFEIPTPMMWPPGHALGKNKFTSDVLHQHLPFALEGHDVGPCIGHVSIPPDNPLLIPTFLGSSRKVNFTAGEVRANGKGVACCYLLPIPFPRIPSPMSVCGKPVSLPSAGTGIAPLIHSLIVGQHWIDVLADAAALATSMCVQFLMSRGAQSSPSNDWNKAFEDGVRDFLIGGDPSDGVGKAFRGAAPGMAGGLVRGLVRLGGQYFSDYQGPGGVNLTANLGPVEVGIKATREVNPTNPSEGQWSGEGAFRVGGEDGPNLHGTAGVAETQGGSLDGQGQLGVGGYGGSADLGSSTNRTAEQGGGSGTYGHAEHPLLGSGDVPLSGGSGSGNGSTPRSNSPLDLRSLPAL